MFPVLSPTGSGLRPRPGEHDRDPDLRTEVGENASFTIEAAPADDAGEGRTRAVLLLPAAKSEDPEAALATTV